MARVEALEKFEDRAENRLSALERTSPTIDRQSDWEKRLRSVEAFRWQMLGAASFFAFLGSALGPLIKALVTGH